MHDRSLASVAVLAAMGAIVLVATGLLTAQSREAAGLWTTPRTAWGDPDLLGIWDYRTVTPLERPGNLADKEFLTDEEVASVEQLASETGITRDKDKREGLSAQEDLLYAYNDFWWDWGTTVASGARTSLIVVPADGRVPSLTPAAQEKAAARRAAWAPGPAGSWEDVGLATRCLLGLNSGPPMLTSAYNNNVQIFQTPEHVALLNEMIHSIRVIPLDGRPHIDDGIRQWKGDSRGRWEGDTLVVDTTNFTSRTPFRGSSRNMRLVERFTRAGDGLLLYEFTIDDLETFTSGWSAVLPMVKADGAIYEYACHEGNYGLANVLSGARAEERTTAEAAARRER